MTTQPNILFITFDNNAGYFDKRTGKTEYMFDDFNKSNRLTSGYRLNDGKVSPNGKSYFVGSMMENTKINKKGQLFDIDKDKSVVARNINTTITNGICWDNNENMFFADSTEKKFYRVDHMGFIDIMPWKINGEPDGACMDVNGLMYNAEYGANKISIYNTRILEKHGEIKMPCLRPTCPTWGGDNRNILFCTSAIDSNGNGGEIYYKKMVDNNVEGMLTSRFILPFY